MPSHSSSFPLLSAPTDKLLWLAVVGAYSVVILARKRSLYSKRKAVQARLSELDVTVPTPPPPKGNYVACVRVGNLLHLCGHIPTTSSGDLIKGKVGKDLSVEQGYESARACAINILGTLSRELAGDFGKVKRIVKVVGFVNCTDDFTQQPAVINGASDLFGEVFGECGQHARSAVGTNSLPLNIATEVECIAQIEP